MSAKGDLRRSSKPPGTHLKVELLPAAKALEVLDHCSHNLQRKTDTGDNAAQQLFRSSKSTPERASSSTSPNLLKPSEVFQVTMTRPASRTLLQHYQSRTADLLCASQSRENPFISLLIPFAATHELLLQCILALSGVHFINNSNGAPSSDIMAATWTHYGLAVRGLKHGITRFAYGEQEILPLLMATLVLCFVESTRGNVISIAQHLKAARTFLLSWLQQRQPKIEVELRGFVIEFYLYIAILSNTQLGPEWNELIIEDCSLLYGDGTTDCKSWGMFFGYANDLFGILPAVSAFAHQSSREEEDSTNKSFEFIVNYYSLLAQVNSWHPPEAGDLAFVACGRIYQQALLLLLHTSFYRDELGSMTLNNLLEQGVREFLALLESLPVESPIATTLCWPLSIAGSCARSELHRNSIRKHLKMMYKRFNMENITAVLRVLEALWDGDHYKPLYITTVMRQQNEHFIIQ
ncbi:hypothetical protein VE04_06914, partial [Pseudogymnoascus sp. 24MN13]